MTRGRQTLARTPTVGSPAERIAAGISIARAPTLSPPRKSQSDSALEVKEVAESLRNIKFLDALKY